ncbi:prolyl oligopeptidase family serine peptidase [Tunturiibacter gelidoferens]|uniref:prolyl oligopeptidase n=1 Tax=Tunturiibacter gelidiferens TaxID=3069689 RepID=A0AAU7Z3W8_9BACT
MTTNSAVASPSRETTSALTYPTARRVEQTDNYFGTTVSDPYRWMEDVDSSELKTWVDAENEVTQAYLSQVPSRETMQRRLMELINFERYTAPARRGTRYFYSHNSGLQNQNVIYWQEGLEGEPKVLLDPNTFSTDGTVAISGMSVTDDGSMAAYSIADAGSDWVKWHVRDVTTGEDLPDIIEWSKFSGAAWLKDGSGFFYEGYDAPEAEALKAANYFHKVFFHKLGTPQSEDKLVFDRPDDKELNLGAHVTDDGRYLVLYQSKGTSPNNEIAIKDLQQPDSAILRLIKTADATYAPINNDGTLFWLLTTLDAPNGKVISIDLNHPEREHWKTVIPESKNKLSDISIIDNTFIANYLADAQSLIELRSLDGQLIERLKLPAIGTAYGFGGLREDTETFYQFTNFTTPGTIYRLNMKTRQSTLFRQPKLLFDPALYETTQIFYTSKDGTRVPMFVSHKKSLVLNGSAPTLLYAYGGFNVPLMPEFSSAHVMWMEMGGVYAQPSLRGGGEYGEAWHEAGTRLKKQNVFDDFIAAAEWLIANKYTSAAKLATSGGSNGGLLVAACELQRPDLFGAVIAQVGVMDMLRFDKFTIGWAWKEEYGSPSENAEEFAAIYKYSPLHNILQGTAYPATLITTGDHDDRVYPAHSFKYTAALQAAQTGPNPILIRVETRAGHGAGMPLSKRIEATVDQYAFLVRELKVGALGE